MGNFLLIAPDDWTEIDFTLLENFERGFSASDIIRLSLVTAQADEYFGETLRRLNMIPQTSVVLEARLIENMYFYVRLS